MYNIKVTAIINDNIKDDSFLISGEINGSSLIPAEMLIIKKVKSLNFQADMDRRYTIESMEITSKIR